MWSLVEPTKNLRKNRVETDHLLSLRASFTDGVPLEASKRPVRTWRRSSCDGFNEIHRPDPFQYQTHTHGKLLSRSNSMQMFCAWLCLCGDLHLNSENYEEHARPPVANSCNATNQSQGRRCFVWRLISAGKKMGYKIIAVYYLNIPLCGILCPRACAQFLYLYNNSSLFAGNKQE